MKIQDYVLEKEKKKSVLIVFVYKKTVFTV